MDDDNTREIEHNKVLHERNVFPTVQSMPVPHVASNARITFETIGTSSHAITIRSGFMEAPDGPQSLMAMRDHGGMAFDPRTRPT